MKKTIKPGLFSLAVAADSRRGEFDCKNETIIEREVPVDFVFIGDSITEMWELPAYFGGSGQRILNRGIGGDITPYLLKRFPADAVQLKPKHCILLVGINDTWALDPDYGTGFTGDAPDIILEKAAQNFTELAKTAVENNLNLVLCSVLPTNCAWEPPAVELLRQQYIVSLNAFLRNLAAKNQFIYVDYFSSMIQNDGLTIKKGISMEGLHPNVSGYNIMAQVLQSTLAAHHIILT